MSNTIRFTLNLEALVKLRDTGYCKFKSGNTEYQIIIDEDLNDSGIFLDPFEIELEDDETEEDNEPPEFYPPIEDRKDYT